MAAEANPILWPPLLPAIDPSNTIRHLGSPRGFWVSDTFVLGSGVCVHCAITISFFRLSV